MVNRERDMVHAGPVLYIRPTRICTDSMAQVPHGSDLDRRRKDEGLPSRRQPLECHVVFELSYSVLRRRSQPTTPAPRPTRAIAAGAGTAGTDPKPSEI